MLLCLFGGKNTNAVLVGHTGITARIFFDNLKNLENNDLFYIHILNDILEYEVIDTKVVLPDETESIKTIYGEDRITLVTCTPKYVNSHRLLVTGKRTKNINNIKIEGNVLEKKHKTNIIICIGVFLTVSVVILLAIYKIFNR
ncbi:MAG: class C sortase [Clostridia bacterium]|nr:class C sortase [Clostridia bacterium]